MSRAAIRTTIEAVGALVDAAAFDLGAWQTVIDALARALPGTRVLLQVVDPGLARAAPVLASGWDAAIMADYARHYGAINPWLPIMIRAPSLTTLYSEELLAPAAFRQSEFYQDWLRHIGEADASTGVKLVDHGGRLGAITLSYDARRAEPVNAVAGPMLAALAPRMRRALDLGRTAAAMGWHPQVGPLLAAMAEPALIVTRGGRVLAANAAADRLAEAGGVLRIGAGDRLAFADQRLGRAFATGLREACAGGPSLRHNPTQAPPISTPAGRFALTVIGLRPDMLATPGLTALLAAGEVALVVIRAYGPGRGPAGAVATLALRYGLSPAEARLAEAMAGGRSLPTVAADLGIAHETARSQLKHVFAKLGVSRQAELVAVLLEMDRGL